MKRWIFSLVVLACVACGTIKPCYLEYRTERPLAVIDSLAVANKLEVKDTTYWDKTKMIDPDSGVFIDSYLVVYPMKKDHQTIISLTKASDESDYTIYYRVE